MCQQFVLWQDLFSQFAGDMKQLSLRNGQGGSLEEAQLWRNQK
jgi:predicted Rdx family selenoprotein